MSKNSDSIGETVAKRTLGGLFGEISSRIGAAISDSFVGNKEKPAGSNKQSGELECNLKVVTAGIAGRLVQMDLADMTVDKTTGEVSVNIKDPVLHYILTGDNSRIREKAKENK